MELEEKIAQLAEEYTPNPSRGPRNRCLREEVSMAMRAFGAWLLSQEPSIRQRFAEELNGQFGKTPDSTL